MTAPVDPAARIGQAVLSALRDLAPANDTPRWVDLAAEARRRGMTTTALRAWCLKVGVVIREESHRRAFVSPQAIDAAVEGLPVAKRAPSRQPPTEQLDADIETATKRHGRRAPR